jgi:hypothetical protein
MATYTKPTISNYNDNPPTNDGSTNFVDNGVDWDRHIDEIGDPLNNYSDSINNETSAAFGRIDNARYTSVTDYGATGDGATDDTAAIQSAITAVENASGGVVFFPYGEYLISSVLTIVGNKDISLLGESWGSKITISGTGIGIKIGNSSADQTAQIFIDRLRITGNASSSHGVQILRSHACRIYDCRIEYCGGDGINLGGAYSTRIVRTRSSNNTGNGIYSYVLGGSGVDYIEMMSVKSFANAIGIYFDCTDRASAGVHVTHCDIEGNGVGIQFDVGSSGNSEAWSITNTYFENQSGKNLAIGTDGGSGFFRSFRMMSNNVNDGTSDPATNTCEFGHIQSASITNNLFADCNVSVTTDSEIAFWSGNTASGSTFPSGYPNRLASFEEFQVREDFSGSGGSTPITRVGDQLRIGSRCGWSRQIYPGTAITGAGHQTDCGIHAGTGAPDNGVGNNGDFYFRADGTSMSRLYVRLAGVWNGIL